MQVEKLQSAGGLPSLLVELPAARGAGREVSRWHLLATREASRSGGFANSDISLEPGGTLWKAFFRFTYEDAVRRWESSAEWGNLRREARAFLAPGAQVQTDVMAGDASGRGVMEVIVTKTKPGKEDAYREWQERVRRLQSTFPGYLGAFLQPPTGPGDAWTILVRFDTVEDLRRWRNSRERKKLLEEIEGMVEFTHARGVQGSFPGWFPASANAAAAPPPKWKTAALVFLGIYPAVSITAQYLAPHLTFLPPALATAVTLCITVPFTAWVGMPILLRFFGWWVYASPGEKGKELAGACFAGGMLAAEVAAIWLLSSL